MTDPTALGALRTRVEHLTGFMRHNIGERDRYQRHADACQEKISNAMTEINSIEKAIALLEAAATYQP